MRYLLTRFAIGAALIMFATFWHKAARADACAAGQVLKSRYDGTNAGIVGGPCVVGQLYPSGTQCVVNGMRSSDNQAEVCNARPVALQQGTQTFDACFIGGGPFGSYQAYYTGICAAEAPAPSTCTSYPAGTVRQMSGDSSDGSAPDESCDGSCKFTASGLGVGVGTSWSGEFTSTGQVCAGQAVATSSSPDQPKCQMAQGNSVCTVPGKPQCIKVNGVESCTSNNTAGFCTTPECQLLAAAVKRPDNSVVAKPDAVASPVPYSSQTSKSPADATFSTKQPGSGGGSSTTQVNNYYSGATTGAACVGPCKPGEVPGRTPTEKPVTAGDPCTSPECASQGGSGAIPSLGAARTFSDSLGVVAGAFGQSPLAQSVRAISFPQGGSCPAFSFDTGLLGVMSFAVFCDIAAQIMPTLGPVMIGVYSIIAITIFLAP